MLSAATRRRDAADSPRRCFLQQQYRGTRIRTGFEDVPWSAPSTQSTQRAFECIKEGPWRVCRGPGSCLGVSGCVLCSQGGSRGAGVWEQLLCSCCAGVRRCWLPRVTRLEVLCSVRDRESERGRGGIRWKRQVNLQLLRRGGECVSRVGLIELVFQGFLCMYWKEWQMYRLRVVVAS